MKLKNLIKQLAEIQNQWPESAPDVAVMFTVPGIGWVGAISERIFMPSAKIKFGEHESDGTPTCVTIMGSDTERVTGISDAEIFPELTQTNDGPKTAHQLGRELLSMPDLPVVTPRVLKYDDHEEHTAPEPFARLYTCATDINNEPYPCVLITY